MLDATIPIAELNDKSVRFEGVIVQFIGIERTLPTEDQVVFIRHHAFQLLLGEAGRQVFDPGFDDAFYKTLLFRSHLGIAHSFPIFHMGLFARLGHHIGIDGVWAEQRFFLQLRAQVVEQHIAKVIFFKHEVGTRIWPGSSVGRVDAHKHGGTSDAFGGISQVEGNVVTFKFPGPDLVLAGGAKNSKPVILVAITLGNRAFGFAEPLQNSLVVLNDESHFLIPLLAQYAAQQLMDDYLLGIGQVFKLDALAVYLLQRQVGPFGSGAVAKSQVGDRFLGRGQSRQKGRSGFEGGCLVKSALAEKRDCAAEQYDKDAEFHFHAMRIAGWG